MKIRVLLHLPKEQTSIVVEVPENKSGIEQENLIAKAIKEKYPNYYKWGTISWIIDWPKEINV